MKPIEDLMLNLKQAEELGKDGIEVKQTITDLKKKLEAKKEIYSNLTAWQRVQISRHPQQPYTLDYIQNISEDYISYGDRNIKDDKAMIGGGQKLT